MASRDGPIPPFTTTIGQLGIAFLKHADSYDRPLFQIRMATGPECWMLPAERTSSRGGRV